MLVGIFCELGYISEKCTARKAAATVSEMGGYVFSLGGKDVAALVDLVVMMCQFVSLSVSEVRVFQFKLTYAKDRGRPMSPSLKVLHPGQQLRSVLPVRGRCCRSVDFAGIQSIFSPEGTAEHPLVLEASAESELGDRWPPASLSS